MLEPDRRDLLLDALRPPEGYALEQAVGTTYSLDLNALLIAPLAFALMDWAVDGALDVNDDDGVPDVLALLEAVRRNADRITIFCQAGEIALPRDYRSLVVYLEPCVVEVTPPDAAAIFHPKVWALKYASPGAPDHYRLLCLSRNLTFDRAWDTALVLDGHRLDPEEAASAGATPRQTNAPLVDFLAALPGLAVPSPPHARVVSVAALAEELRDVAFEPPEGFESLAFHAYGLGSEVELPTRAATRSLVVSPFLTRGALTSLGNHSRRNVLVSRQEALDAVGADALSRFEQVFVLAPHAWREQAADAADGDDEAADAAASTEEAVAEGSPGDLTGLHAKLYVVERGDTVHVHTGSANATDAAFHGNVEFLVEMVTTTAGAGIDGLLAAGDSVAGFGDLLQPARPTGAEPAEETAHQRLARLLDRARRQLAALRWTARLEAAGDAFLLRLVGTLDGTPDATLDGAQDVPLRLDGVTTLRCWPISLGAGHVVHPTIEGPSLSATFGHISREAITSFFAFELAGDDGTASCSTRFVTNVELLGAPPDRRERVVVDVLRNRGDVLRYLLLLLADPDADAHALAGLLAPDPEGEGSHRRRTEREAPLLETLLRALSRDPRRLDHVARLFDDLRAAGRDDLLPEGIDAVWPAIWAAREKVPS